MTLLKLIAAGALVAGLSMPAAGQMSETDHSKMDHSQMNHDDHDHDPVEMEVPDISEAVQPEGAPMIVAKVNGLVCDFCAQALRKVFKKEEAVESLSVDLDAGEVRIILKPGMVLDDETVKKLIRKSGYSLVSTSRIGNT